MELEQDFLQVMNGSVNMALATSAKDKPNVRVVTFGFDEAKAGKLYFSTFKGNRKTKEFQQNPRVACMPLPMGLQADYQVRIFGQVKKSELSLAQLIGMIEKKAPGYAGTLMEGGDMLEVYEVAFAEAWITIGMGDAQKYEGMK